MRFNEKEIILKSSGKAQIEGRLNYKKNNSSSYYQSVFKEKWFKLIDNCLFYFRINDAGHIADKDPTGVLILENASIQLEHCNETPFAFSISFVDEPEKRHMFSGMSDSNVNQWVINLRCASYEYLRSRLHVLQSKIYLKTGMDPLLMVPRNEGSMKWAPGEPLPIEISHHDSRDPTAADAATHVNVFRSKSSVSVFDNIKKEKTSEDLTSSWSGYSSGLERSKTVVNVHTKRHNPFNDSSSIKENYSHYLRPAPSPPIRKKNSYKPPANSSQFYLINDNDVPPIPPSRKNSPRHTPVSSSGGLVDSSQTDKESCDTEDLIQF